MNVWLPPLALFLDLCFADPARLPHPVQGIGFLADRLEGPARRLRHPLLAGALVLLVLLCAAGGTVALLISLPFGLGGLAALYCAWAGLALGGLAQKCTMALYAVREAQADLSLLPEARGAVQMLVSRDTADMNTDDLYRSLAESVSENFNDAFVAPYFWLCLGGPVALWLYKTASTMDSMWGYRTERWRYLGRASARLDDMLAFVPARLSAFLLWLTARLLRKDLFRAPAAWPGFAVVRRQAGQSASPNAGWPMAAAAWLFGGRSGGPTPYHGKLVDKPLMGPENGRWTFDNTAALIRHLRPAGLAGGLLAALAGALAAIMPACA